MKRNRPVIPEYNLIQNKRSHIESNKNNENFKRLFRCSLCEFIAGTPHNLTEHIKSKHNCNKNMNIEIPISDLTDNIKSLSLTKNEQIGFK